MAAKNYPVWFGWEQVYEGGYINHPKDPGGATNHGVIQRNYDAYRDRLRLPRQDVRKISAAEVRTLYKSQYWDTVHGDHLPSGIDVFTADFAVNSGPGRAIKCLQQALGVRIDGVIGTNTLAAAHAANPAKVIQIIAELRMAYLKRLRIWPTFGKGWTRRVMGEQAGLQTDDIGIADRAIMLAGQRAGATPAPIPMPKPQAEPLPKALDEDVKPTSVALDMVQDPNLLGAAGTVASSVGMMGTLSGPLAWAVAGVLLLGGVYLIYRLERSRRTA